MGADVGRGFKWRWPCHTPEVVQSIVVDLRKCIKNVIFYFAENSEERWLHCASDKQRSLDYNRAGLLLCPGLAVIALTISINYMRNTSWSQIEEY